jgi:hypothetical protein
MEVKLNAPEATSSLPNQDGLKPRSWRSDRIFSASKACAFCGKLFTPWIKRDKETNAVISACPEKTWNMQLTCSGSCAKRLSNPMSNHQVRLKVKAKLREIKHKPIRRGGNGQLLPLAQLALLHALGEGWESEYAVATHQGHRNGVYPNCYKLDIANPDLMIGIELDGSSHCGITRRMQDKKKTDLLVSLGWSVYRVSNARALELYSTFKSVDILLTSLTES